MRAISIPEQGQLVDVRQSRFVVTDVHQTQLPKRLAESGTSGSQHLITLSSVEDDALGQELQVIWELEPGAHVYEKAELPEPVGFDSPERLDAFLDAVRWGAASVADVRNVQSPFRSGIDIEDYQLDPVVRAVQMPRVNLLIADDVGLGKTIEAGLVAQELILRQRARRILIICPSSLQVQWQEQMRNKFGLDFRIVNSELMKGLRRRRGIHVNPWGHFPRLITSIDFIKRDRPLRLFREILPAEGESLYPRRFDLMIVDEAHNVAPSGSGKYAIDSQRTAAIRLLEPHFEHKLFLTATPHNGYPESFTALLELLDAQRFARGVSPDPVQLQTVMVRRLKQELPPDDFGKARFPERVLEAIAVNYTEEEQQAHQWLQTYTELRRQGAQDNPTELYATEFVLKLLKKRLFSSPEAFRATLVQHQKTLRGERSEKKGLTKPAVGLLRRQLEQIEEEFADDDVYEEVTADAIATSSRLFHAVTPDEQQQLDNMQNWADQASLNPDTKAQELLNWIAEVLRPSGDWGTERVIIFTEYRATQKWLFDLLANEGYAKGKAGEERLMTLYGGMDSKEREQAKAAFQAKPEISPVRILLATDAASEGLDLQNHCSRLIHYEIPWNPNRMEQRNGRVDRHGQRADEVSIYHFVAAGFEKTSVGTKPGELAGDLEFLMRAALKVNTIREDLGKVGPVIASQVEEAMLGRRGALDTAVAEKAAQPLRKLLRFERSVQGRIEQLKAQLGDTRRELRLSPENITTVVKIGLDLANQPPLEPVEVPNLKGKAYQLPALQGSWAECSAGLAHPHTNEIRPIVFDADTARGRDDVVLVHLNHRLVQMCLRLLRAEVWSRQDTRQLYRVTARVVPSAALDHPVVVAYGRLVVLGGDQQRLHEEIITAGGVLKEGRFSRFKTVGQLKEALAAAQVVDGADAVPESMVQEAWPGHREALLRSLEVRMENRTQGLQNKLAERCEKEVKNMTAVLTELRQQIIAELAEPEVEQMELFSSAEKEQLERNLSSLRLRVEQIPQEIEQEAALIRARFAEPMPRLFPLAVAYLVPQKLIK
ncbi:Helicase conserved C-terminal domain protein [Synechococcus sp. PCC 7335]|uniref:DISARM system SNF2-like helicase DrmD n=1 Tax=Synechococcus sp. (strain ATCC 29403 / PCC 7335) TaxID=91464 RepID=UPI00017EE035|nr:DISARM system SNF2-like helicase DrmD [Synechococcus sp. PCC 7335]EDX86043.1 Helicase conserved C-terminal domain protein [Synechococcus sp. PCC 7335]